MKRLAKDKWRRRVVSIPGHKSTGSFALHRVKVLIELVLEHTSINQVLIDYINNTIKFTRG